MTLMTATRRGFIGLILAAAAAPAIIRTSGLIMPIKPALIVAPETSIVQARRTGFQTLYFDERGRMVYGDGTPVDEETINQLNRLDSKRRW